MNSPREKAPLGVIRLERFLRDKRGNVVGQVLTDAKVREYRADYSFEQTGNGGILIQRSNGSGDRVSLPAEVPIDEELLAFFGLYSGDGSKGSEDPDNLGRIKPSISFSQKESNILRFALQQFRRLFPNQLRFTFSLGEDSAFFMDGEGLETLRAEYGGRLPKQLNLSEVRPVLNDKDQQYLRERRDVPGRNEDHLAFYYQHKEKMQLILTRRKKTEIEAAGIQLGATDKVTSSLRRPFKKGARAPGGTSRADEMHVGGLNGIGELFLKMIHEVESSLYHDTQESPSALVKWSDVPSRIGEDVDVARFFAEDPYGSIAGERPTISTEAGIMSGKWPRSTSVQIKPTIRLTPLFAYASGLYLAEGGTPKAELFAMYLRRPKGISLAFTSSEDMSLGITLRALSALFTEERVVHAWKIKVGSQYFAELVSIGLKHGVPMLRGGKSGDGKLRTMEISISLRPWALEVYPSLKRYEKRYSHVEPTGAGVARVDFWASSAMGRWILPLMVYVVFRHSVPNPKEGFSHG